MLSINSKGLINLDLSKLIASKKRNSIVIEALINQNEYTLEKDSYLKGENSETLEKFIIKDNVTNRPVNLSRFTKDIDKLNNLVKEKTEKRGKKIEKLFTFDKGTCRLSINLD